MRRSHVALVGLLAGVGLVAAGCGGSSYSSSTPPPSTAATTTTASSSGGATLDGAVGPGFTIALQQNGQAVTTLAPGAYVLSVNDQDSIHNFHLVGPGVDAKLTSVEGTGVSKPVTLALKKGSYTFFCDVHPSLEGSFEVS